MNEQLKQLIMTDLVKCTDSIRWNEHEFSDELDKILASRPTCGKEQRKFLDEVEKLEFIPRKDYNHDNVFPDGGWIEKGETNIDQDDFEGIDLQKVIRGE